MGLLLGNYEAGLRILESLVKTLDIVLTAGATEEDRADAGRLARYVETEAIGPWRDTISKGRALLGVPRN